MTRMVRQRSASGGFTLIEILVVIIIVGVLAGLGMPLLFRNVERSRAAEALNTLGVIRRAIESCATQYNMDATNCTSFNNIGMSDPSNSAGNPTSHFNYIFVGGGVGPSYSLTASRTVLDNGDTTSSVVISRVGGGPVTRFGTSDFAGIQ